MDSVPDTLSTSRVPVKVAARILEMRDSRLIDLMESGAIDIGIVDRCRKKRGKRTYRHVYISPKKFYEFTGFIWSEQEKEKYMAKK